MLEQFNQIASHTGAPANPNNSLNVTPTNERSNAPSVKIQVPNGLGGALDPSGSGAALMHE